MSQPKTHAQWLNITAAWLFAAAIGGCCIPAGLPFLATAPDWKAATIAASGILAFSGFTAASLTMAICSGIKAHRTPR